MALNSGVSIFSETWLDKVCCAVYSLSKVVTKEKFMDLVSFHGVVPTPVKRPSLERLECKPKDLRAEHCQTVEEYRLFKFSSSYQSSEGGNNDLHTQTGVYIEEDYS